MDVALVGTGGWGKNCARVLSEMGALCAVCDVDAQRGKKFAKMYSVDHYETVEEMIASAKFDAVHVATPTSTHFELVSRLLEAKKHVLVEKPITYRSDEGAKLAKLAERKKLVLTCGYIERFNPVVNQVKSHVRNKKYGDLIMLEFHRENRSPLHIKDTGIIYDTAVHDIDTANWLFDEVPTMVFARAGRINHDHEDFASIMLGYKEDKLAVISANWITPKKIRTFGAVCTDAVITSDYISQQVKIESEEGTTTLENKKQEPLRLEIESFLGAVRGDNDLVVKPQQAVNVTMIAEAALLSSQKGVPIYLELK